MSAETVESGTAEEKAPRATSKTIIAELRALGYTGPVSYNKTQLLMRLDEVKAGTYVGKGAPGADEDETEAEAEADDYNDEAENSDQYDTATV